jgi:L-threonylcarbamoyladenylate synthase
MNTQVLQVNPQQPEPEIIGRAVDVLRKGGLVAFPTETVYGIGANALDPEAAQGIFNAKGRPARNPLIVHIPDAESVLQIAQIWPDIANKLAARFWPGPMTLVLPKKPCVPATVTGGGPTVAVRVPAHPVALAILRAVELPIAAPSANRSTGLSPTLAEHVLRDLDGRVHLILDGGQTPGGLESTVIDLSVSPPRLLRPGLVRVEEIEEVLDRKIERVPLASVLSGMISGNGRSIPSPGILGKHYAPRSMLEIAETADGGRARVEELARTGHRVGWVPIGTREAFAPSARVIVMPLPPEPALYANRFYATLHALDILLPERIVVAMPPDSPEWLAVRDRLHRAAAPASERPAS